MIEIKYDGSYPALCCGTLIANCDGVEYNFGSHVLVSGGYCSFTNNFNDCIVAHGKWELDEDRIPADFPKDRINELMEAINSTIPFGCCGGCL